MNDDATLLQLYAQKREETAFAELVRRHLNGVYAAAWRRVGGDQHLAQDVAQQVFIALARKAGSLARHPSLTSWLHTATRHEAANVVRGERRRKAREQAALIMEQISSDGESAASWRQVAPILDGAIDELNERDRTAVLLRFVERRGFVEIGQALCVTEDAARMRVDRALEKLRALLARRGVTSTASALGMVLTNQPTLAVPTGLAAAVTGAALTHSAAVSAGAGLIALMSTPKIIAGATVLAVTTAVGLTLYRARVNETTAPVVAETRAVAKERGTAGPSSTAALTIQASPALVAATTQAAGSLSTNDDPTDGSESIRRAASGNTSDLARRWLDAATQQDFLHNRIQQGQALARDAQANFFAQLRLTPEQIDAMVVLLTEKRIAPTTVAIAQLRAGALPDTDSESFHARVQVERAKTDREINSLLGDATFGEFQSYNRQRAEDIVFTRLNRAVGDSPNALTADQTARLRQLLRQGPEGGVSPSVIRGASGFLSEIQIQALQDAWESQEAIRRQRFREALPPPPVGP